MKNLHKVSFVLLAVGGLNWFLEAFGTGLGAFLPSNVAQIVYILVGLSAVNELVIHKQTCRECMGTVAAA
jgi:uncharacterized membrane protein YuzA (DUF378 family)